MICDNYDIITDMQRKCSRLQKKHSNEHKVIFLNRSQKLRFVTSAADWIFFSGKVRIW